MRQPSVSSTALALRYRGRFAPTPSGPLHLGSLLTALAGWLQAQAHGGEWLLRIDDLDRPRCAPGATDTILKQLEHHGLDWHGTPRYQSHHLDEYQSALESFIAQDALYACGCTRNSLQLNARPGPDDLVYPGTCCKLGLPPERHALRLRVIADSITLQDPWQGTICRNTTHDIGDFILRRSDGQIAYQLACVIDEHAQGITEVVRGADLIGSSLRQLYLLQRLQLPTPAYRHLPVIASTDGRKLSKQNHAAALNPATASENLWHCLLWLGQAPEPDLRYARPAELLSWAEAHWQPSKVPARAELRIEFA